MLDDGVYGQAQAQPDANAKRPAWAGVPKLDLQGIAPVAAIEAHQGAVDVAADGQDFE